MIMPAAPIPIDTMPMQTLEVDDFSGGITDYYLGAPLNRYQRADNLLLVRHGDKAKLITRPGSELYSDTALQIPAGAQRIGTIKYHDSELFWQSARKLYYISGGSFTTLQGPSSNDLFPSGVDTATVVTHTTWRKHLLFANSAFSKVQKVYKDGSTWKLRTAGLPALASSPTGTPGTAGANSYIYRFLMKYTYTVGTLTYVDRGPSVEVLVSNSVAPDSDAIDFTSIPVLANSTTHNYDTASSNLVVEIYRTTAGGVNFFYVGQVTNGTTTYSDSTSDATLSANEPLYTEGGVVENGEPPLCKYVHATEDRCYYAYTKVSNEEFPNRFYQSVPGDIDAVPDTFYGEVEDEIGGISSVKGIPIVFCINGPVYRAEGVIDLLGQGDILPRKISDNAGIASHLSIVQTLDGIFWAGLDGFYFTDGYRVIRISDGLDKETYAALVASAERKRRIVGKYDTKQKRIWWSVQQASTATDNDSCFVLDLSQGISTDMPFTTVSGGDSFSPTSIEFIDNQLIRADRRGYTFRHDDSIYTDPKVDTAVTATSWTTKTIIYDLVSAGIAFGTTGSRKWVSRCGVQAVPNTNLSLQIVSINDDGRLTSNLKPVRFRGVVVWGDADVYWGDPNLIWNYEGIIDETRRFPKGGMRCQYKQVQMTNAFVAVVSSDVLGEVDINATTKKATLTGSLNWPAEAVDYYIAFERDNYDREYLITARTNTELTYSDSGNTSVTAQDSKWVLRGYPRGEVLYLLSYTVDFSIFGATQKSFDASATGEVGA